MSTVNVDRNGFASIILKLANMRKEQSFTIYPYSGGEYLNIQSGQRFAKVDLRTGSGIISGKNHDNNGYHSLMFNTLTFTLPAEALTSIQKYLWELDGKRAGNSGLFWENKPLLSVQ